MIFTRKLSLITNILLIATLFFSCKSNKKESIKISKNVPLTKTLSKENIKKDSLSINSTKNNIKLSCEKDAYEAALCMCKFSDLVIAFSKDKSKEMQIKLEKTSNQCTSLFNKVDSIYDGDDNFKELYLKYIAECE